MHGRGDEEQEDEPLACCGLEGAGVVPHGSRQHQDQGRVVHAVAHDDPGIFGPAETVLGEEGGLHGQREQRRAVGGVEQGQDRAGHPRAQRVGGHDRAGTDPGIQGPQPLVRSGLVHRNPDPYQRSQQRRLQAALRRGRALQEADHAACGVTEHRPLDHAIQATGRSGYSPAPRGPQTSNGVTLRTRRGQRERSGHRSPVADWA